MKKIETLVVVLLTILLLPFNINAAEKEPINVHIFKGDGCGYCAAALEFFESIESEYGDYFNLVEHEVWYDENNATLMTEVASYFGEEVNGVPYIIIGDKTFQGYAETYNSEIITAIEESYNSNNFVDRVEAVQGGETSSKSSKEDKDNGNKTTIIVIAVALIGFVVLFYFARDSKSDDEEIVEVEETKVVEEPKKEEVKKASTPKKVTTAKTTTTAKKTSSTKTNNAKKTASKKTTTSKNSASKKTTAKKTTKK